jgi:hypothetical protein
MLTTGFKCISFIFVTFLAFTECSRHSDDAASTRAPSKAAAGFVNRVWKVSKSSSVSPGTLYVFLSDGTLVITSRQSKPALGSWSKKDGGLIIVEEGLPHRVEVLRLEKEEFTIKIHNPGEPVVITFVPA